MSVARGQIMSDSAIANPTKNEPGDARFSDSPIGHVQLREPGAANRASAPDAHAARLGGSGTRELDKELAGVYTRRSRRSFRCELG